MDFRVGDRVVCTSNDDGASTAGMHGTVVRVPDSWISWVTVEYDELVYKLGNGILCGHTGNGHGKDGFCWDTSIIKLEHEKSFPEIIPGNISMIFGE